MLVYSQSLDFIFKNRLIFYIKTLDSILHDDRRKIVRACLYHAKFGRSTSKGLGINKLVRPRWPYDMRPSVPAEKYMCVIVIR